MIFFEFLKIIFDYLTRNKLFLFFILLYLSFVTYFLIGISVIDPDFGWSLRVGEIIMQKGVPKTDPFTYTMPGFPYVDHSWLFSYFIALTYPVFSGKFLSLLLAFCVYVAVFIAVSRLNDDSELAHADLSPVYEKWLHPMVISVIAFFLIYFSIRAQIVSWIFFSILNLLLFRKDNYSRYKYFLPIIFLIWANLHGGYSLGIAVLGYFVFFRLIINKKGSWKDILVLVVCVLTTLLTPYGLSGWREVASSVFDSRLRWTIAEWLPSLTFFDVSMIFYVSMSSFMVFMKRKNIAKIQLFLFWVLFTMALTSRRNMPYFMLYSLPLTISAINKFYLDVTVNPGARDRFRIAFNFIRGLSIALLLIEMFSTYWKVYFLKPFVTERSGFYPAEAVNYLKDKNISGEIFSNYGWGGYLIWKLPEKKVFIDGRMPSWKFTPKDPDKETESAYSDYLAIESGELDFNSVADKYNIDYVLWPVEKRTFLSKVEDRLKSIAIFNTEKNNFSFLGYLNEKGWKLIYSDLTAQIYIRL